MQLQKLALQLTIQEISKAHEFCLEAELPSFVVEASGLRLNQV
jgi:hypothetical protein